MSKAAVDRPIGSHRWRSGGLLTIILLLFGWGCAGQTPAVGSDSLDWMNSVLTAEEPARITPSMSVTDRLAELRRAKESAYRQLITEVLALRVRDQETVSTLVTKRPQLHQQIESYVYRVAVVDTDQNAGVIRIRTRVEVGAELADLLHLNTPPPPSMDRNTPSTGVVRPLK